MADDREITDWIRRARRGERRAFGLLIEALGPRLLRYCLFLTRHDEHRARDLAQDVWLKALRGGIATYRQPVGSFATWLRKIAHNQHVQNGRRQIVEREAPGRPPLGLPEPARLAEYRDLRDTVLRRVAGLPLEKRRALGVYLETGSPALVAELLGISPIYARVTIYRIMLDLRDFLAKEE